MLFRSTRAGDADKDDVPVQTPLSHTSRWQVRQNLRGAINKNALSPPAQMRTHVGAEMLDSNVNDKKNIERDSACIHTLDDVLPATAMDTHTSTDVRPVPRHHQSPPRRSALLPHASLTHTSTRLNITRVYTTRQRCKSTRQHSRAELPTPKPLIRGQFTAVQNKFADTSRSGQLSIDLESMVFCSTAWNQQPADTARPTLPAAGVQKTQARADR